ncbi:MAG: hypothetical protein JWO72_3177 [Caulobacteraceae bacterium]|jgi:hypothetical protein|nr:hypothetical protein [Caulobacteraceae bacterium]
MQNGFQRNLARLLMGGREGAIVRMALAARYASRFNANKRRTPDRFALYDLVSREVIAGRSFDYLEFGVFQGASIACVAAQNRNPQVRLYGFDSFEGLPVDWNTSNPKGTFDVSGKTPLIADERVAFVKGWFDQTLPRFLRSYEPQEQLWIHIDADLYGSAIQVLTLLNPYIKSGTVIVFDEVEDLLNEFRALCDFEDMSNKKLVLLAATGDCRQAAFVCA